MLSRIDLLWRQALVADEVAVRHGQQYEDLARERARGAILGSSSALGSSSD
jgi:hypothetical protein